MALEAWFFIVNLKKKVCKSKMTLKSDLETQLIDAPIFFGV